MLGVLLGEVDDLLLVLRVGLQMFGNQLVDLLHDLFRHQAVLCFLGGLLLTAPAIRILVIQGGDLEKLREKLTQTIG